MFIIDRQIFLFPKKKIFNEILDLQIFLDVMGQTVADIENKLFSKQSILLYQP